MNKKTEFNKSEAKQVADKSGKSDSFTRAQLYPIVWQEGGLCLLDQRALPKEVVYLRVTTAQDTAKAITDMAVRGAPAIGITAAYGVVLAYAQHLEKVSTSSTQARFELAINHLRESRPTAINLHHAIARMLKVIELHKHRQTTTSLLDNLLREAKAIHAEDLAFNQGIAKAGLAYLNDSHQRHGPLGVLTHCNTGSLATGGLGTALGIIKTGAKQGVFGHIYATETRPWLQGSRLTAFELNYENIDFQLLVEGAVASLMASGAIHWVLVGADRITANGDVANKVGTLMLAVLAKHYGVKVMVAAPLTTVDLTLAQGSFIPIEYRGNQEILSAAGYPKNQEIPVFNPVFDVTPAELVDVIVTELGAVSPAQLADHLLQSPLYQQ